MKEKLEKILENKKNYLNRLVRAFKPLKPVSAFSKTPTLNIPRAFKNVNPLDMRWAASPQNALVLFQKIVASIQEPQRRVSILDNLVQLTDTKNHPDIMGDRMYLQDQIFRGVTGHHYGVPIHVYLSHTFTQDDLQNRDFFRLIGIGIHSYESALPETREKFNKAVMPNVKKQNVAVPYRLQQYVR